MLIGVTGNIGSGKTKVAEKLGTLLGAMVLDADLMCRNLMEPGGEGFKKFIRQGGERFVQSNGMLDRGALRNALFRDSHLKRTLELILHPLVRKRILEIVSNHGRYAAVVAEIPLLFESGWDDDFDVVITVTADEKKLVGRVVERDGDDPQNVQAILAAQMSQEEKCRRADYIINNSGEWDSTEKQIIALAEKIKKKNTEIRESK